MPAATQNQPVKKSTGARQNATSAREFPPERIHVKGESLTRQETSAMLERLMQRAIHLAGCSSPLEFGKLPKAEQNAFLSQARGEKNTGLRSDVEHKILHPRQIVRSKFNRDEFDQEELGKLTDSIREKGVIQSILVRDFKPETIVEKLLVDEARKRGEEMFELVAGERRWLGATAAEALLPAQIRRGMSDEEVIELQALENFQREDLNPLDEAEKYRQLLDAVKARGIPSKEAIAEVAQRLHRSRTEIYDGLNLLKLPELTLQKIRKGTLPKSHAKLLTKLSDPATIEDIAREITTEPGGQQRQSAMPYRQSEEIVEQALEREKNLAEWQRQKAQFEAAGKEVMDPAMAEQLVNVYKGGHVSIAWGHDKDYVVGNSQCQVPGADYRTYEKLWKKAPPEILARGSNGMPAIIYRREAAIEAVKAGGKLKKVDGRASSKSASELKAERALKIRRQVFGTALAQIVGSATTKQPDSAFWKALVGLLLYSSHSHAMKGLCKRRGWPADDSQGVDAELAKLSGDQLRAVAVEFLLHDKATPSQWVANWDPTFTKVCELYNVDLARLTKAAGGSDVQTSGPDQEDEE